MKLHANTLSSNVYWNISFEQGSPYGAMSQEPWDPWKDQTQYETGPRNSSAFKWFIFFCASYFALPLNVLFILFSMLFAKLSPKTFPVSFITKNFLFSPAFTCMKWHSSFLWFFFRNISKLSSLLTLCSHHIG